MKTIEVKASTVEEAIEKGLLELNKKREDVEIEITEVGGFLKKAKVILTVIDSEGEKALDFVTQLIEKMKLNITVELKEQEDKALIFLAGEDSGKIIGYRGDVLDSVQYISSVVVNRGQETYKKIIIDCENYRLKREETLISLASKLADKAVFNGRKVFLEPMNPFERRIIHSALQENDKVNTASEGIEPNRAVVIVPKNLRPYDKSKERQSRPSYEDRNKTARHSYDDKNKNDKYQKKEYSADNKKGKSSQSGFSGFGTYLGNTKSGFTSDNDYMKKSGFDNLKD